MIPPDSSQFDSWALHAVVLSAGDGSAPLDRVVATGDYINHAVFTPEELHACLGRLLAGGLVVRRGAAYAPAEEVRAQFAPGSITAQRETASRIVEQAGVRTLPPSREAPTVAECAAAIAAYYASARSS